MVAPTAVRLLALLAALRAPGAIAAGGAPPPSGERGEMVALGGGFFMMGELVGPARNTVAWVRVRPFLVDRTEVTVAEYARCVTAGRCKPASPTVEWEGLREDERALYSASCNRDRADRAEHPANCVDWNQATAYCAWAGKRLPSEEEWEWAARNGKRGSKYPWGNEAPGDRACWNGEANDAGAGRRTGTCPVASHPAGDGATGIADLAGNVWEWTSSATVVAADSRGRGGTPVKVARGGSWAETDPARLTASARFFDLPARRSASMGFRCAKSE